MTDPAQETFQKFMRLTKIDEVQRTVSGVLAAEVADLSGEILDYETGAPAFKVWSDDFEKNTDGKSKGNVRAMHGNVAAGKLIDISFDAVTKSIMGTAKIVDDNEWKKCQEGVYTGFSLGGSYAKRWQDPDNKSLKRYTPSIVEVSIVDLPCIPVAKFEVVKAGGTIELRKFKAFEEADAALKQVWLADDGSTFDKKQDALQKNLDLKVQAQAADDPVLKALAAADAALAKKEGDKEETAAEDAVAKSAAEATVDPGKAGSTDGPGKQPEKAAALIKAVTDQLKKGLYDVARCAELIESLRWFQADMAFCAMMDDADSPLPANLKEIIASLLSFLSAMIEEVKSDLVGDGAAGKAAEAKLTQGQVETIRKAFGQDDLIKGFPVEIEVKVTADTEAVQKLLTEATDELTKAVTERDAVKAQLDTLTKERDDATASIDVLKTEYAGKVTGLVERIEKLEAQPAPAKGFKGPATAVSKGHEGSASGAEEISVEAITEKYRHLPPGLAREAVLEDLAKARKAAAA